MNRVATVPRTPTSASSSILMSSPSTNSDAAIFHVKQEDQIEYQLLSPISASSPMHHGVGSRGGGGHHTKIIKVTPTAVARKSTAAAIYQNLNSGNDHEYFSTPITPSTGSATPTSRIYVTPTGSSPVVSTGPLLMPNTKVEARRRLNLDSALVDQDGFKTPIKGTKRKHDFSSPSPKKCKLISLTNIS